uniref:Uncharacterized protein n=1 Tax=Romanomermis culicivorax TaxID=13658 RepID=A0A915KQU4_ROMCU
MELPKMSSTSVVLSRFITNPPPLVGLNEDKNFEQSKKYLIIDSSGKLVELLSPFSKKSLTSIILLLQTVRLDHLFDQLSQTFAILFALQHFAVDGDFGVQRLLGVQQHLQFDHQRLAFVAHLAYLGVAVVQGRFVLALVVFQLITQFAAQIAQLNAQTFRFFLLVTGLHILTSRRGLDFLNLNGEHC